MYRETTVSIEISGAYLADSVGGLVSLTVSFLNSRYPMHRTSIRKDSYS
jgi:hypothetical protein